MRQFGGSGVHVSLFSWYRSRIGAWGPLWTRIQARPRRNPLRARLRTRRLRTSLHACRRCFPGFPGFPAFPVFRGMDIQHGRPTWRLAAVCAVFLVTNEFSGASPSALARRLIDAGQGRQQQPATVQLLPTTAPRQAQSSSVAAQVLAGAEYVPDRLLVRFRDPIAASALTLIHADVGATVVKTYDSIDKLQLVRLAPGSDVVQAIEQYRSRPDVLYAEPDWIVHAIDTIPDDTDFDSLWGLHNTGQSGGTADADIDAPAAWDLGTGSSDVIVVVIDSGVDYNHQDLAGNMFQNTPDCNTNGVDDDSNGFVDDCYGIDTVNNDSDPIDDNDHGTHVSGTIGAVGNNSVGVTGVNWNVSIMACKFLDSDGSGPTSGAIDCFGYIDTMYDAGHTNIVASNNSWGGGGFSQALADAIDSNRERGILAIAAAGNDGTDNDLFPSYPSNYFLPNIIAVAATDRNDGIASFSQFGSTSVHIGAPGVAILSTTRNDTYQSFQGTSMATPHVAGVAALMRAQNPTWDWLDIKNRILAGGDNTSAMSDTTVTGKRLNAFGSLTCSNSVVNARLQPLTDTVLRLPGSTVNLASLHINCGEPNGSVSVSVSSSEGNSTIDLEDDGLGNDLVASDGIYSGTYTASTATDQSLTFPGGDVVDIPQTRPNTPTSLTVTPASRTEINVSWLDNSSDETNFHLERAPGSTGSWSAIAFPSVIAYLDTGLTCNTTYDYRVRAHRHGDNEFSDYSNTATATTQDCVELSIDDVSVQEGDAGTSTALFTVSLSGSASETVQVDYATLDGSADGTGASTFSNPATIAIPSSGEADPYPSTISIAGAQVVGSRILVPDAATSVSKVTVTLLNFSHGWADGETAAKTVTVDILDDEVLEVDETVHLTLSTPTGGATLGTPSEADLTILDDGAVVIGLGPGGGGWMDEVSLSPPHARRDWFGVPWNAYNTANGETRPVFCNLDGEGSHELVVGLGPGGGGWVEVRAGLDGNFAHQAWTGVPFSTYNTANGETRPACGDLDGDGRDEIVIGLGPGARGILEIRDDALANFAHLAWIQVPWAAYDNANGETFPAVGDLDGDGLAEIVIGLGTYTANGGWVEVREDAAGGYAHLTWIRVPFSAYNEANGEVHPATGDLDGDGSEEIVLGLGTYTANGGWVEVREDAAGGYTPTSRGSGSSSVPITRPMGPPGQPLVMWMETARTRFCSGSGPTQRTAGGSSSERMRQVGLRTPPGVTWTTAPRERPDRRQCGHRNLSPHPDLLVRRAYSCSSSSAIWRSNAEAVRW